jgi:hypothetical protein
MITESAYSSRRKCLLLKILIRLLNIFFFLPISINIFFLGQNKTIVNHPPHFNIAFMRNSVSTYAVSTNVACLRTTYDVTLGDDYDDQDQSCQYLKKINESYETLYGSNLH